ncbi:hypothetical protein T265_00788 [Opisthorchis viverrini]|uniref:Major facilitator superfamily (MFS) profile domain-containing protein n=1 Tax=Opisthorchis viverrini TaxID=6198 RepID=A0A075A1Q2_OPIVI|nr:hypothetical protein T265_00788 [Opisthorchis viverrini]KER33286.1 hypothetical protein T265_00788 [Opisthorchis viverrini]
MMRISRRIFFAVFAVLTLFVTTGIILGLWWQVGVQAVLSPGQYGWFTVSFYFGAIIGSLLSCRTLSSYGRHWTLHFSCLPNLAGWFYMFLTARSLSDHAVPILSIFMGRLLTGVAVGLMIPGGLIYLIELAPADSSGLFGCLAPLGLALGSTFAHATLAYANYVYFVFAGSILLVFVNLTIWLLPESPRWLAKTEQFDRAAAACSWFGCQNYQQLIDSESSLKAAPGCTDNVDVQLTRFQRFKRFLFGFTNMSSMDKSNAHLAWRLLALQQLTLIGPLLNFCESLFTFGGSPWTLRYAGTIGLPQCVFTAIAALVVSYTPRKNMLHCSTLTMSLSYFILGVLLKFDYFKPISPFTVLCVSLCLIGYSLGWGPIPIIMVAEMFNTQHRGFIVGSAMVISWILGIVTILLFEPLTTLLGAPCYFWLSSFACVLCTVYVHLYVPETNTCVCKPPITKLTQALKLEPMQPEVKRKANGLRMKGV